ncbi:hypothetical protein HLH26_04730 [Gluconacetobacter sp. 1b LMG 1731]|uniref:Uncharacterized protein n=1 Tax=Gluconacetobacter dulcium TaxID=2729096 RepID=A0A7W4IJF6_9PROT|nr:hypothetical protein [Gluconacetobacter dulcium]MBB2163849.1 hypothetical protein [Gluconacetobacter dulcium]MBB2193175.1 hypothetical protein [Gluconacetobacter dulcium]
MPRFDALPPMLAPLGLGRSAAAQFIGVGEATFDRMVQEGLMPKGKRVFRRVIWDRRDLADAMAALDRKPGQTAARAAGTGINPWDELLK